ncbi:hypothetical protein F443_15456 [Phytophthora nicotianae P1569]|uniref:Uncharacterized protein n=1 Tax=Phytophthora nicotianae P1569 TaxID=1317065 RepID=V9EJ04_PHYNI|nr:hypothetical protein F443_15456 [Phytophthora nicotianae P1569]
MHQCNALCAVSRINTDTEVVGPSGNVMGAVDCFMPESETERARECSKCGAQVLELPSLRTNFGWLQSPMQSEWFTLTWRLDNVCWTGVDFGLADGATYCHHL